MQHSFKCPYCGKEVGPCSDNSVWAESKRFMGQQTLSYAHLSCVEAAMLKNKKEVPHDEG